MTERAALITQTTVASEEQAQSLGRALLEKKLAACVWILPPMTSLYIWKGKLEQETERCVVFKSVPGKREALEAALEKLHPYECPEIMSFPVEHVTKGYAAWLQEQCGDQDSSPS